MTVWHKTPEYGLITAYYGSKCARRSGVPYMHHIREGIKLLLKWNRPEVEQRAFALHPIVQAGGVMRFRSVAPADSRPIHESVFALAEEYGQVANKYLCNEETDWITQNNDVCILQAHLGDMSPGCAWMLLADKVQNQEDFRRYHWFTHDRADELERYFNLWIRTITAFYL